MSRILCVCFNGLKSSNSNGRTLQNLLYSVKKEDLAVFYCSNDISDYSECSSYYRVTDSDLIKSLCGKKVGKIIKPTEVENNNKGSIYNYSKQNRRNQAIRYFRQKLWGLNLWQNNNFWKCIENFKPEVILLFSGNNAFLDKIAWQISKKYNIPIVLFNCESYYLQKLKYNTFFGRINRHFCDRVFKKTMSKVSGVIYNTEKLQKDYDKIFPNKNSIVFYQPSTKLTISQNKNNQISYLGNISDYRIKGLVEIANILASFGEKLHLYGACTNDVLDIIKSNNNIIYHGLVDYNECCKIMVESKLLIHTDPLFDKTGQFIYAFSGKIGDCLVSGVPLFLYGPENCAITEYLQENNCAFVCTKKENLKETLYNAIYNNELREAFVKKALEINSKNHNIDNNSKKVKEFIECIIN